MLKVAYTDRLNTREECYRCDYTGHRPDACGFKFNECHYCKNKGHSSKVCRKKAKYATTNSKIVFPEKSQAVKLVDTSTPLKNENMWDGHEADVYDVYTNTYDGIRKVQPNSGGSY